MSRHASVPATPPPPPTSMPATSGRLWRKTWCSRVRSWQTMCRATSTRRSCSATSVARAPQAVPRTSVCNWASRIPASTLISNSDSACASTSRDSTWDAIPRHRRWEHPTLPVPAITASAPCSSICSVRTPNSSAPPTPRLPNSPPSTSPMTPARSGLPTMPTRRGRTARSMPPSRAG